MLQTISRLPLSPKSCRLHNLTLLLINNNLTTNPPNWTTHGPVLRSFFSTLSFPFSSSQILHRRQKDKEFNDNDELGAPPKLFVVQPRFRPEPILRTKLEEALNLANSLDQQRNGCYAIEFSEKELPPHLLVQNPLHRSPRAGEFTPVGSEEDTYFRKGAVDIVKCHLNALESLDEVDAVFVNASLTGIQQRNLERIWGKPVLDRVGLIIEIFHAHAQTKEAKLQAELAALMYKRSRLVRLRGPGGRYTFDASAEVVSARGRGSGGRGFISGAGETELQLQRRRILERRNQLLTEIKEVRRTRAVQRAARKRHGRSNGLATVAVVGYTNAGKSTLVSNLSDSYLYCDDRLFATVDPKLRGVILPSGRRKVLLSDTVGFISDLPVQLVEAFQATLEEVVEADLLVHVLDSSSPNLEEQRDAVLQVLKQIGVSEAKLENMIEVWNKIDLQSKEFGSDEYGEDEEVIYLSEENESDQEGSGLDVCDSDDDVDTKFEVSGNLEEDMEAQKGDYSDGWLLSEEDSLVDYEGSSVGQDTPGNLENWTFKKCRNVGNAVVSQSESSSHVKSSALMGASAGQDTPSNLETWNFKKWRGIANAIECQSESSSRVKISALTGVGLQELLELIDVKLDRQKEVVLERSIFNHKWRPPRSEDTLSS